MALSDVEIFSRLGGTSGVLEALLAGRDLSVEESRAVLNQVFDAQVDPVVVAALLIAWRAKGETADELTGMVRAMLAHATPVVLARPAMDIVGTGGDGKRSVNISTMTALVVAGAGVAVCKHGSRAASSSVGSADLLEALGVTLELSPEQVAASVEAAGIGFCFAPCFHPAMKNVAPVRRALGIRTAFNFLGPLANPSRPEHMLLGTAERSSMEDMAAVLGANGIERAWIVRSEDGFDELTLSAPSRVVEVLGDGAGEYELSSWMLDPATLDLEPVSEDEIRGGDLAENVAAARSVLAAEPGPVRRLVLLNAAAALVVAGHATDIEEGVEQAARSIDEGAAQRALTGLVACSRQA
jgi:anthranilate phosphoribosyltransferase